MTGTSLGVGVIGCGNISSAYFRLARLFRGIEMRAGADLDPEVAKARTGEFNVRHESVDGLLRADDIDIVVNLTVPAAHYTVSRAILESGKHVYSEKPLVLTLDQGLDLQALAASRGLRIGSSPDTFLGGSHQLARHLVDDGRFGKITSGTCHVMSHGMEHWHPSPEFFYKPGGGPVLDLGPYYLANLIQLIGPVARVAALCAIPAETRVIASAPRRGEAIRVETPTTIHALLEFVGGATVSFNASWDVWDHGHAPMELYGEEGSLRLPDPNFFGGKIRCSRRGRQVGRLPRWDHPFSVPNQRSARGALANYRGVGLAEMAMAILAGRPHRCSLEAALHGIDVMTGILESGRSGAFVAMRTTCERPQSLDVHAAKALLAEPRHRARAPRSRRGASTGRRMAA